MKARISFAITVMALSLVLAGCQVKTVESTPSNGVATQPLAGQQAQPTTVKAGRRDIVGYRLLVGHVYLPANASADVVSSSNAPVQSVDVKVNDHVSRGQTLVTLASGQQENYQQAKTTYDAAVAAYNQALAQYEQPVKDVQRQLDQARSTEKTLRESTTPGGDATALQQAVTNRHALEDQLRQAQTQAKTNELQYKSQLDQAKLALSQARSGVRSATITAPISGTVVALQTSVGQNVAPNTVVAKIVDLPALAIKCDVTPVDAPFIKQGTKVAVVFGDYPDRKFDGRVRKLDALPADQDGKVRYAATIDFDNTGGAVKPNSTVRSVGVVVGHRTQVVTVPLDAVGKDTSGKPFVKVMEDGNWKPVVVDLGMSDGNFVEIKSGVRDGDEVQVVPGQGQWLIGSTLTATS